MSTMDEICNITWTTEHLNEMFRRLQEKKKKAPKPGQIWGNAKLIVKVIKRDDLSPYPKDYLDFIYELEIVKGGDWSPGDIVERKLNGFRRIKG